MTNLVTSAETVQEIIHLSKNTKRLARGIKVAKIAIHLVNELLPINQEVIKSYLKYVATYRNSGSRDLIHLAVCVENKIGTLVTFDRDFSKFKEVKTLHPQDVIN